MACPYPQFGAVVVRLIVSAIDEGYNAGARKRKGNFSVARLERRGKIIRLAVDTTVAESIIPKTSAPDEFRTSG
jgi:hypothetical protein